MTGSIRKVAFLAVCGLLCASAAFAGAPNVGNSDIGVKQGTNGPCANTATTADCASYIRIAGFNNSNVVPLVTEKIITIMDGTPSPVQNSTVEIRFGACTGAGEFLVCGTQPHAGVGVDCPTNTVVAVTNASGQAIFRVVGSADLVAAAPSTPGLGDNGCAEVRADGTLLGYLRVKTYDFNGAGGVNPVDLAYFLADSFSPGAGACASWTAGARVPPGPCAAYRQRSDYNDDGRTNPVDLSLFLAVSLSSPPVSPNSCVTTCAP